MAASAATRSLQDVLDEAGSAVELLSAPRPVDYHRFPYPPVHTNWRDEQRAWAQTAVLLDQSYHMTDLYITGPDTVRLLSDTSIASYANFRADVAKQYLATNEDGYMVADSIVFGLSDDEAVVVGHSPAANWLEYHAEHGDYDVSFVREPAGPRNTTHKRVYRYELEGPNAWKILEKVAGRRLPPIKFFGMGSLEIAGAPVRTLNHTMGGIPGEDATGLELFGPMKDREKVIGAIIDAGQEFGLLEGGALAYRSACLESGWLGLQMPAIWSEPSRPYREWLDENSQERFLGAVSGSFRSERIEDYYVNPWDMGYGRILRFDHDFIGRAALERIAERPPRTKVWFTWNDEDAARVLSTSAMGVEDRAREMALPIDGHLYDEVRKDSELVGLTVFTGHTVNLGGITSVGFVDVAQAVDGNEVEIVWGEHDGGASNPFIAAHEPTPVRATITRQSPIVTRS